VVAKGEETAAQPAIVYGEGLAQLGDKVRDAVARRAYELFEARGRLPGHDVADWFRAENELVHPVSTDVWQSEQQIAVTAEIPGFCADEVTVGVEPERVILWGRPDPKPVGGDAYPHRASIALYHTIDLPVIVDPAKASARLTHGLLRLELPKAGKRGTDETSTWF
jgi:HSP20 family molecular chaperone IbpA